MYIASGTGLKEGTRMKLNGLGAVFNHDPTSERFETL